MDTQYASDPGTQGRPVIDGRYRLDGVIAEGGMGIVYAATHVELDTPVAVKVLKPELGRDALAIARFRREARAASALGHPHIVEVRDFGTTPSGAPYCVMERLEGRDLEAAIGKPFAPARAASIALQVLDALATAHRHGIVHRDLKPQNIFLVGREEHVKVLDFGVAKVVDEGGGPLGPLGDDPRRTVRGIVVGTPLYMSPEQCADRPLDARSDLYSVGVVLYEMLTGTLPFDVDDVPMLLRLHVEQPPLAPSEIVPEIPSGLDDIVLRCLAKDREARFASAEDLATALRPFATVHRARSVPPPAARPLPAPRAWGALAAAIAIGVVGSIAGGAIGTLARDTIPSRSLDSAIATPIVPGEPAKPATAPVAFAPIAQAVPVAPLPVGLSTPAAELEPEPELTPAERRRARRLRAIERRAAAAAFRERRARSWHGPVVDPWQAPR